MQREQEKRRKMLFGVRERCNFAVVRLLTNNFRLMLTHLD